MKNHLKMLLVLTTAGLGLLGVAASPIGPAAATSAIDEFDEFEVFVEINATDGDAGLQGLLDGDAWKRAKINGPQGHTVFDLRAKDALGEQGASEFQWESNEPNFSEFSLEEFLARFPEGEYTAEAKTIDGGVLESSTELTHDLPAAPNITSHQDGDEVELDGNNVTVTWDEVTDDFRGGPLGSEIVYYLLTVEFEGLVNGNEVQLETNTVVLPDQFSAQIPADFLVAGREYKIELGAQEESGNKTFTEIVILAVNNIP